MNDGFSADIAATHEGLSPTARRFLDRAADDPRLTGPDGFDGLFAAARRVVPHISGLEPGDDFGLQPWPIWLGAGRRCELERVALGAVRLTRRLPELIFDRDPHRVAAYYGIDLETAELVLAQEWLGELTLARADVVDTEDGPRLIELNVGNLGGWQHVAFAPAFAEAPALAEFLDGERAHGVDPAPRDSIAALCDHVLADAAASGPVRADGELNLLVVASDRGLTGPQTHPAAAYRRAFAEAAARRGLAGRLDVAPVSRLELRGDQVRVAGRRYHAVVEQNDGKPEPGLFAAAVAGGVRQYTGPAGLVLGDKRNLVVLSMLEESDLLDREERRLVRDAIPWTRHVRPGRVRYRGELRDLERLAIDEREGLVLKAAFSFGGADVVIGRATEPAAWESAVRRALDAGGWVIQEYLRPRRYAGWHRDRGWAPHEAVWGLFVFGQRPAGSFVRMAPTGDTAVLNMSRGARVGLAFEC